MKEEIVYEPISTGNNVAQVGKQIENFSNKYTGYLLIAALFLGTVSIFQIEMAYYTKMFDSTFFGLSITLYINLMIFGGMLLNINNVRYNNKWPAVFGIILTMGFTVYNIVIAADLMAYIFNPSKADHYAMIIKALNTGRAVIEVFLITTVISNNNGK